MMSKWKMNLFKLIFLTFIKVWMTSEMSTKTAFFWNKVVIKITVIKIITAIINSRIAAILKMRT